MNFKLRSDINARTALVYGGAAFLLVIVGFRSIFATLDPDSIGLMTYLSIPAAYVKTKTAIAELHQIDFLR